MPIQSQKSWMNGVLFEEWVQELDQKFASEGIGIAVVRDNCPAHTDSGNLEAIKLFF